MQSKVIKNNRYTCYIGLGSNLENPTEQINQAIISLDSIDTISVVKVSSFYETKPVGYENQPNFINAVAKLTTNLSAHSLLKNLLKIEAKQKRVRSSNQNMARTLDLDLLLFGNKTIHTKDLIVPHPRMKERSFVLVPLYEIAPKLTKYILGNYDFIKKFNLNSEFKKLLQHKSNI